MATVEPITHPDRGDILAAVRDGDSRLSGLCESLGRERY
jgi:hypothetical protein